jgi:hypothetical protein
LLSPELSYIVEAIGNASAIQAQTSFQLKLLQNESKIKVCKDFEEEEGRINTDMLSRLIIVGGPLIQAGPGMQDQLVKQVPFKLIIQFFPHFPTSPSPHRPVHISNLTWKDTALTLSKYKSKYVRWNNVAQLAEVMFSKVTLYS